MTISSGNDPNKKDEEAVGIEAPVHDGFETAGHHPEYGERYWKCCARFILLLSLVGEVLVLTFYFTTKASDEGGISASEYINGNLEKSSADFYLHDAAVASSFHQQVLSMSEMVDGIGCTSDEPENDKASFIDRIPNIVLRALQKNATDRGRIVEYADEKVDVSENYEARIRGVTLACIIVGGLYSDISPGAYASHLVASTLEIPPRALEADAYDTKMLMEADVMELGVAGHVFTPRKYCFDLDDLEDRGITKGLNDSFATFNILSLPPKSVSVGSKSVALQSFGNRVALVMKTPPTNYLDLLGSAYHTLKSELVGIIEAYRQGYCTGQFYDDPCLFAAEQIITEDYGLEFDMDVANGTAWWQFILMYEAWDDWSEVREASSLSGTNFSAFGGPDNVGEVNCCATPFVFDRDIAAFTKNGFTLDFHGSYASPYLSQSQFMNKMEDFHNETVVADCVNRNGGSYGAGESSLLLKGSIQRRLFEYQDRSSPHEKLENWFVDSVSKNISLFENARYWNQSLPWDSQGKLMPGNLTEKRLGLTANWYLADNYDMGNTPDNILELLRRHRESAEDVYSRSASRAVDDGNDCAEAATNSDIFLLFLGMAATFCGGVTAFMQSLHSLFHWFFKRRYSRVDQVPSGYRRIIPTYELGLTTAGALVYFSLYVPFVLQVIKEFEIYHFQSVGSDMAVFNTQKGLEELYGKASLVTLVFTETQCSESRPFLLVLILVNGFLLGLIVNMPYIHMSFRVCARYCQRFGKDAETSIPKGTSVFDSSIRIIDLDMDA